jgi:hypothetical protein
MLGARGFCIDPVEDGMVNKVEFDEIVKNLQA